MIEMNSTFLTTTTCSYVEIDYFYVGTGNITSIIFQKYQPVSATMKTWVTTSSNASLTWIPEAFQSQQLKATTEIRILIMFEDSANLPSDGDYYSISMTFYETTTIFSQETIMLWLGASMAALDIMGLLYASGFLSKYIL